MKLMAINGSPRKNKNTGSVLTKICEGAVAAGAMAELIQLRDISPFKGCVSCFHCKQPGGRHYGRCAVQDELTPVLEKAHQAEVVVLGTPFYFSSETALMRAFMERFWFQYYLYTARKPPLSPAKKATALVYTMNVAEKDLAAYGKTETIRISKGVMERLFGNCEIFLACETKQFDDYSKYEVDLWDVPARLKHYEEVFPQDLERAFQLGQKLASRPRLRKAGVKFII